MVAGHQLEEEKQQWEFDESLLTDEQREALEMMRLQESWD